MATDRREQFRKWKRENREKHLANKALYRKRHRDRLNAKNNEWRKANLLRTTAHNKVSWAIISGKLSRPDRCDDCGQRAKLHAHHEDYAKPLEVQWLCPGCHHNRHRAK
jgi:hypothetical protein